MRACVALLYSLATASCLTLHQESLEQPMGDIQVPLQPVLIKCGLSDLITISAPVVRDAQYYLNRPDGSALKLNISRPTYQFNNKRNYNTIYDTIAIKHKQNFKTIEPIVNYNIFDLRPDHFGDVTTFEYETKDMKANDFLIGPLMEQDHGNWILSIFYQDEEEDLVEMYQVITIEISDYVPPKPRFPTYSRGDTFEFSFAYAIPHLESCELHAPKTTFDRFYERDMTIDMARCGYVIKNVTREDRGTWSIIGVGRIVYETQVVLEVEDKLVSKEDPYKHVFL